MTQLLAADAQRIEGFAGELVVGRFGQRLGVHLGGLFLPAAVVQTLAAVKQGLGQVLARGILGRQRVEGGGGGVIHLGLSRLTQLVLGHPQIKIRGFEQLEVGIRFHHDLKTLLGQIELVHLEVTYAQVMERPIKPRIGPVGINEFHPLLGGRLVDTAVLQRHGRVVLPRSRFGLLLAMRPSGQAEDRQCQHEARSPNNSSHQRQALPASSGCRAPCPRLSWA